MKVAMTWFLLIVGAINIIGAYSYPNNEMFYAPGIFMVGVGLLCLKKVTTYNSLRKK